ncbi:oxygen-independent coproporphyrinogen III oxidase [Undibacterium cyanobacteriorum]|uniref:Coproporphyrinogen-III oxidase n=1 Tax=Undibacterium cyanobacteriorum TaxID=3073561 RepID=A0ABY9RM35_9BURK|nr:oxygen-independent coproporphyrinogen III oxidase [Undibacterium sp. 20NA77.5]WMW82277.1 oxygen-independent coproporphyrinogen III oxidase [Undibacterium sp. 20NA77.5]
MDTRVVARRDNLEISEDLIRRFDSLGPRYTSYPTADRFHAEFNADSYIRYLEQRNRSEKRPPLSLYIHVPFCASLCYYCACNKVITKDRSKSATYLQYLEKELQLVRAHLTAPEAISQLHLGGGTPTFLSHEEMRQLMTLLRNHFSFTEDAEISIEIDPRTVTAEYLHLLAELGFNRTSLGVQDFDEQVQQAVHRIQPFDMVAKCIQQSRDEGFGSINFDLIYGLPKQNLASFSTTLDRVIELSPARIALYNYAHLPTRFKPQRRINEADLPSAEERLQIFLMSIERLLDAGYIYIGLDHFAKPDDSLAMAMQDKSLHRNFQGYTTRADCDLIALGLSAIGKLGASYVQNVRTLDEYYAILDQGKLPVEKGFDLDNDDLMRREIIMELMCSNSVNFAQISSKYQVDFHSYFAVELERLAFFASEGLIAIDQNSISVLTKGRMFVRAFAMIFDKYLAQSSGAKYSKLI